MIKDLESPVARFEQRERCEGEQASGYKAQQPGPEWLTLQSRQSTVDADGIPRVELGGGCEQEVGDQGKHHSTNDQADASYAHEPASRGATHLLELVVVGEVAAECVVGLVSADHEQRDAGDA